MGGGRPGLWAQTGPRGLDAACLCADVETLGCTGSPGWASVAASPSAVPPHPEPAASASAVRRLSTNACVCPLGAGGTGWPAGCTRGREAAQGQPQPGLLSSAGALPPHRQLLAVLGQAAEL